MFYLKRISTAAISGITEEKWQLALISGDGHPLKSWQLSAGHILPTFKVKQNRHTSTHMAHTKQHNDVPKGFSMNADM